MNEDDGINQAREGIALVGDILKAAGDSPNVKAAGKNLGDTALTITKTINNALLPLAAVNFAFDKAKDYFDNNFQTDLSLKAKDIPEKDLIEPKASIAGPALQGLAFTHDELNLKDMYLSLLTTAMNTKVADDAHPAFVEIIKQLNSEEAGIIQGILKSKNPLPITEARLKNLENNSWSTLVTNMLNLKDTETKKYIEDKHGPAMVDNWIRLGLVEVDYAKHLSDNNSYDWVNERPETIKLKKEHDTDKHNVIFQNGIISRTSFGFQFAQAVGMFENA
jgi:hypothetical protein